MAFTNDVFRQQRDRYRECCEKAEKGNKYGADELKVYIRKQKELRKQREVLEYEERERVLESKKQRLRELDVKCKQIAATKKLEKKSSIPIPYNQYRGASLHRFPSNTNTKSVDKASVTTKPKVKRTKYTNQEQPPPELLEVKPSKSNCKLEREAANFIFKEFENIVRRECRNILKYRSSPTSITSVSVQNGVDTNGKIPNTKNKEKQVEVKRRRVDKAVGTSFTLYENDVLPPPAARGMYDNSSDSHSSDYVKPVTSSRALHSLLTDKLRRHKFINRPSDYVPESVKHAAASKIQAAYKSYKIRSILSEAKLRAYESFHSSNCQNSSNSYLNILDGAQMDIPSNDSFLEPKRKKMTFFKPPSVPNITSAQTAPEKPYDQSNFHPNLSKPRSYTMTNGVTTKTAPFKPNPENIPGYIPPPSGLSQPRTTSISPRTLPLLRLNTVDEPFPKQALDRLDTSRQNIPSTTVSPLKLISSISKFQLPYSLQATNSKDLLPSASSVKVINENILKTQNMAISEQIKLHNNKSHKSSIPSSPKKQSHRRSNKSESIAPTTIITNGEVKKCPKMSQSTFVDLPDPAFSTVLQEKIRLLKGEQYHFTKPPPPKIISETTETGVRQRSKSPTRRSQMTAVYKATEQIKKKIVEAKQILEDYKQELLRSSSMSSLSQRQGGDVTYESEADTNVSLSPPPKLHMDEIIYEMDFNTDESMREEPSQVKSIREKSVSKSKSIREEPSSKVESIREEPASKMESTREEPASKVKSIREEEASSKIDSNGSFSPNLQTDEIVYDMDFNTDDSTREEPSSKVDSYVSNGSLSPPPKLHTNEIAYEMDFNTDDSTREEPSSKVDSIREESASKFESIREESMSKVESIREEAPSKVDSYVSNGSLSPPPKLHTNEIVYEMDFNTDDSIREEPSSKVGSIREESTSKFESIREELASKVESIGEEESSKVDSNGSLSPNIQTDDIVYEMDFNTESIREEPSSKIESIREESVSKIESIREESASKMESIREESVSKVESIREEIREESASKMESIREESVSKVESIREEIREESASKIESIREESVSKVESIREEIREESASKIESIREESVSKVESIKEESVSKIESIREESASKVESIKEESASKVESLREEPSSKVDSIVSLSPNLQTDEIVYDMDFDTDEESQSLQTFSHSKQQEKEQEGNSKLSNGQALLSSVSMVKSVEEAEGKDDSTINDSTGQESIKSGVSETNEKLVESARKEELKIEEFLPSDYEEEEEDDFVVEVESKKENIDLPIVDTTGDGDFKGKIEQEKEEQHDPKLKNLAEDETKLDSLTGKIVSRMVKEVTRDRNEALKETPEIDLSTREKIVEENIEEEEDSTHEEIDGEDEWFEDELVTTDPADEEKLKREAAEIVAEQLRIENEIRALEALQAQVPATLLNLSDVPDKPPPPYSPPSSDSLSFSTKSFAISCTSKQLRDLISKQVEKSWTVWKESGKFPKCEMETEDDEDFVATEKSRDPNGQEMSGDSPSNPQSCDNNLKEIPTSVLSTRAFNILLFDLIQDTLKETLQVEDLDSSTREYVDRIRPGSLALAAQKVRVPKTEENLIETVLQKVKNVLPYPILANVVPVPRRRLAKWTSRPRDLVDEVLAEELIEEDREWTESWPEEILVLDKWAEKYTRRAVFEVVQIFRNLEV